MSLHARPTSMQPILAVFSVPSPGGRAEVALHALNS